MDRDAARGVIASVWRGVRLRLGPDTRSEQLRWTGYLLVCLTVLAVFLWGYIDKPPQEVAFEGEVVGGRGAQLYFEGDQLGKVGVFRTTADRLDVLPSSSGSVDVTINAEAGTCGRLVREFGGDFGECEREPGRDRDVLSIAQDGTALGLVFGRATPVEASRTSARAVKITETTGDSTFPTFLTTEFHVCREGGDECAEADADASRLSIKIRNLPRTEITLRVGSAGTTVTPWASVRNTTTDLVLRIDRPGEARVLGFNAWYRQRPGSFSGSSNADFVRVRQTSGVVNAAGQREAVLDSDALRVRATEQGPVSMTDSDISFLLSGVVEAKVSRGVGDPDDAKDIRRRRLETWPIWIQATMGVLVSGLVVQVLVRLLLPRRLRG